MSIFSGSDYFKNVPYSLPLIMNQSPLIIYDNK